MMLALLQHGWSKQNRQDEVAWSTRPALRGSSSFTRQRGLFVNDHLAYCSRVTDYSETTPLT